MRGQIGGVMARVCRSQNRIEEYFKRNSRFLLQSAAILSAILALYLGVHFLKPHPLDVGAFGSITFAMVLGVAATRIAFNGRNGATAVNAKNQTIRRGYRMARLCDWHIDLKRDATATSGFDLYSSESEAIFGCDLNTLHLSSGEYYLRFVHPQDADKARNAFRGFIADNAQDSYSVEYRIRRADGVYRHVWETGEKIRDHKGRPIEAVGTIQDITEQRQVEQKLLKSEAQLQSAHRMAGIGYWYWEPVPSLDGGTLRYQFSPELAQILGIDLDAIGFSDEDWCNHYVHPGDRERVSRILSDYAAGRTDHYTADYRYLAPDGRILHLRTAGDRQRDAEGRPLYGIGILQDITQFTETAHSLELTAEQLRHAHMQAKLAYWQWHPMPSKDGRWGEAYSYPAEWQNLVGIDEATMRSMSTETYCERHVHPEDRTHFQRTFGDWERGLIDHYSIEYRIIRPDGKQITALSIAHRVRDESGAPIFGVGVLQDITEIKKKEHSLQQSRAQLQAAHRLARMGHWTWEPDEVNACGRYGFSPEFLSLIGAEEGDPDFRPDFSLARYCDRFVHEDDRDHFTTTVTDFMANRVEGYAVDYRLRRTDGRLIHLRSIAERVRDEAGRVLFIVGAIQDVTDEKEHESELISALHRAEAADNAKSHFLANMSHELRTPLNAVIGFSDAMMTEMFGPVGNARYAEYLKNINFSGRHLLELINDILDLSKAEAGRLELSEGWVDIGSVLNSCMAISSDAAQRAGVLLELEVSDRLPTIHSDERRLRQIVLNLLSNAIKFTPMGGRIIMTCQAGSDGMLHLMVSDTGIGMSEEDIPVALEPFRQIDGCYARKYEGTGLGLPLTKRIAELLGGTLQLESRLGLGTTARVTLPLPAIGAEAERHQVRA